ncbi:hypothetical protein [Nocardioides donggukensis]|uniref:Uncharacterized protein n=1 Tax=Nocardioides donggukensis TaxID=2774019 RepID=A0A927K3Q9_9ACTN|nr:hypothetical protein [Nocardioides donggukensis]MBD8868445.1 hypothetical protein [Nocardioides donggukensis]
MVSTRARRLWVVAVWVGAVLATALNGVVVGYGVVWFQLFGETADADDYLVSSGGYGAAAVVLALAVPAIVTHAGPRWLLVPTGVTAAVLGALAVNAAAAAREAEPATVPSSSAWDGIGGVLWAPWTWALVALAGHGLYRLARGRGSGHEAA